MHIESTVWNIHSQKATLKSLSYNTCMLVIIFFWRRQKFAVQNGVINIVQKMNNQFFKGGRYRGPWKGRIQHFATACCPKNRDVPFMIFCIYVECGNKYLSFFNYVFSQLCVKSKVHPWLHTNDLCINTGCCQEAAGGAVGWVLWQSPRGKRVVTH